MADSLSDEQISELKEAFDLYDLSGDGTVDGRDLKDLLKSLGHDPKVKRMRNIESVFLRNLLMGFKRVVAISNKICVYH